MMWLLGAAYLAVIALGLAICRSAAKGDGAVQHRSRRIYSRPILDLRWRPLRDSNPCYRRERAVS